MKVGKSLRQDVNKTISDLLIEIDPYERTKNCLSKLNFNSGKTILVSIGKAAWTMAKAVADSVKIDDGVVITKYNHNKGEIDKIKIFEAGHPIVDENGVKATKYVLDLTNNLNENDNIILCISGGGSALFEKPLVELSELQNINDQLLKSGADINEINIIRKRLSAVKAGKFAKHCEKAHINAIILSDVIGNDLSSIASGPVTIDKYESSKALEIVDKYNISLSCKAKELLSKQTIKNVNNVDTYVIGSVEQLCVFCKESLEKLGFKATILQDNCKDDVKEIAKRFGELAKTINHNEAYIIGGESVVHVQGSGLGGRNCELALLTSRYIKDYEDVCMFAFGSDGTDGPTDAAGGYVDWQTYDFDTEQYLNNNDSYNALKKTGGLIITGPTGSNVNDVYVLMRK